MKEWAQFKSNEAMVNACQIPEKILFSISTEDSTQLCLQYPLLYDIFAFNDLNEGIDKLFSDFNGIRELYKRKEASNGLLKKYSLKLQELSFLESQASDAEKGIYIIAISALEVLLSRSALQPEIVRETSKEILQNLVSGYEAKSKYADYFKGFGFQTNFYSRIYVISTMDSTSLEKLPKKDKNAALFSGIADAPTIEIIDLLSYQLIK